jgi:hypothetical protein
MGYFGYEREWTGECRHIAANKDCMLRVALRGRRSLRDLYTPSVGAPVGRDEDFFLARRSRYTCHEVTAPRVAGFSFFTHTKTEADPLRG